MDIDELAADMGNAGDFADRAATIEVLKAGIAVGVHPSTEAGEMILRMLAFPVS